MEKKTKEHLESVINNYGELNKSIKNQLLEIISADSIKPIQKRRIVKEVILEQGYGQNLTKEKILENLDDKEEIKYLLNRLFVENMDNLAIEKFIAKVKSGKINISKFLDIHKRQPNRNYWQLILLNY